MIVEARRDVVTLRGSLTSNQWPTIRAAAILLLEEHPKGIIIDCSRLKEITEAGAKTFLDGITYIQHYNAQIIVAGLPDSALNVIQNVRAVVSQLPIAPSIEAARASLGLEYLAEEPVVEEKGNAVAVLLAGDWGRAVQIACQVSNRHTDVIHLIDILKVPRVKPLATPMPEEEAAARRRLDDAENAAKESKLRVVQHVDRARELSDGVQRIIKSIKPVRIVACGGSEDEETRELMSDVMPPLLSDPPCEVVYHVRPAKESSVPERRGPETVAVLLAGEWRRAMELVCHLAERRMHKLLLVGVLRVPRSKSLNDPPLRLEAQMRRRMDDADVQARHCKLRTVRYIDRARLVGEGVQRLVASNMPDLLTLAIGHVDDEVSDLANQLMPGLLQNPPCEILYIRRPAESRSAPRGIASSSTEEES